MARRWVFGVHWPANTAEEVGQCSQRTQPWFISINPVGDGENDAAPSPRRPCHVENGGIEEKGSARGPLDPRKDPGHPARNATSKAGRPRESERRTSSNPRVPTEARPQKRTPSSHARGVPASIDFGTFFQPQRIRGVSPTTPTSRQRPKDPRGADGGGSVRRETRFLPPTAPAKLGTPGESG